MKVWGVMVKVIVGVGVGVVVAVKLGIGAGVRVAVGFPPICVTVWFDDTALSFVVSVASTVWDEHPARIESSIN